jgi:hypothetical protein
MEAKSGNVRIVMLLPARTDTRWFHDYIYYGKATEIRFLKGRLIFGELKNKNSAPFPSMLVIFRERDIPDMTEMKAPRLLDSEPVSEYDNSADN